LKKWRSEVLEGVESWQREFVGRVDLRDWMTKSIENAKSTSIVCHIHGMGGIGKSSLLKFWNETIDGSVLIDCNLHPEIDSQVGYLVRNYKSRGLTFPRFDLLWSIRKRVLDGLEPSIEEDRKWLIDAIGLIPGVSEIVDFTSKLVEIGKKLGGHLRKEHGSLHKWLSEELGKEWEEELINILWKKPEDATLLLLNAVQSDMNDRNLAESSTIVILIDNVDSHSTMRWNIDGHPSSDAVLWQKVLSGVQSCISITAGRDSFDELWNKTIELEQKEITVLDQKDREDLYHSRNFSNSELRKSVDRICKGHPFMMQLVIDTIQKFKMPKTELDNIKSGSLDEVRTELWRVFFSRIGQLNELLDRAAVLPFFNKEILSVVYPKMKTKDWMRFQSLSFVQPLGDRYWSLHDLARELVTAELNSSIMEFVNELKKLLIRKFNDCDDAIFYGLSVSLEEFISEKSAIEALNMIIVTFRLLNKSNYILRALEGIRYRGERLRAQLEHTLGNALVEMERLSEAESHIRFALEIQRNLPNNNQINHDIAHTLNSLGVLLGDIGRGEEGEQVILESVKIRRDLANPKNVRSLADLAMTLANLGQLYSILERHDDSLGVLKEAKEIYMELTRRGEEAWYPDLARVLNNLGILQHQMGYFEAAEQSHKDALKIRIQLVSQHPYYRSDLASTLLNMGGIKAQYGHYEESLKYYFNALEEYELMKDSSSDPTMYDPEIAMTLNNVSQSLAKTEKAEEAKDKLLEAVKIYRRLANVAPEKYELFLGNALTNLSMLHLRLKEEKLAYEFSDKFIEIYRSLAESNPFYESYLIHALIIRGNVLSANNYFIRAKDTFQEAIELINHHSESNNHKMKFDLSCALNGIAIVEMHSSNYNKAVRVLKKVIVIRKELATRYPTVYSFELAASLTNIAESYKILKDIDEAETAYRECIHLCSSSEVTSEIRAIAHHTAACLFDLFIEDRGMTKGDAEKHVQEVIEQSQKRNE